MGNVRINWNELCIFIKKQICNLCRKFYDRIKDRMAHVLYLLGKNYVAIIFLNFYIKFSPYIKRKHNAK